MGIAHLARSASLAVLVFSLILTAGCSKRGPNRAAVSGEVRIDNVPLAEGTINFFPTDDNEGPSAGIGIKDGKYTIPIGDSGAVVGKNLVKITGFRASGRKMFDAMDKDKIIDEMERAVGPEFNEASTLIRDVVEGKNTFDFDLAGVKK
ncbi:MAG: hypothetical protein EXS16_08445 [Gemmataceae bacterium]|nr:hypothetical protein [Gemmataceae bacterium]